MYFDFNLIIDIWSFNELFLVLKFEKIKINIVYFKFKYICKILIKKFSYFFLCVICIFEIEFFFLIVF